MSENSTVDVKPEEMKDNMEAKGTEPVKAVSPAQDLRDIQYLLLNGIFPGNVAPSVVKSYHLLEQMAAQIEATAKAAPDAK